MSDITDAGIRRRPLRTAAARVPLFALLLGSAAFLAACASQETASVAPKKRSKEYFAESEYGVKASPRVSNLRSNLPRGGGRDQTGKPYKIRGKWYHPKEDPNYRKVGAASWYGDAFHGRLTANGEIYDMTHLTAAHPTMPLPSYARVTNTTNGSSVIVRVNDRGPYAHGRIIDLSRQAAQMLDYTHHGIAKVEVEYLGRAPLHGQDDAFLMASYRPGGAAPDPSDGMPTGVMIAMNGPTPTSRASASAAFPLSQQAPAFAGPSSAGDVVLPEFAPIAPERPGQDIAAIGFAPSPALAYADERVKRASAAIDAFASGELTPEALAQRYASRTNAQSDYVAVGTYGDQGAAETIARALASAGQVRIDTDYAGDGFAVSLYPDGRLPVDDLLKAAWAAGAPDALTVRE
ncbi:septal ring lytic transglycosylase RlpA family protein [Mesorhizobium sp. CAU 1732]|uniref:septal ring lytic transglycosylase RlpA family protein n=1 Tax=Mesorhizobium sp. CAU 1732 TaxID=3140358 RepID=UPI003261955E